jgi:hypothetical protein
MIGPLDIGTAFSQIPETERIQKVQQQHPDLSQRQFALHLKEQQEQEKTQVQDSERTEGGKIKDDERKGRHSDENRENPPNLNKETDEKNTEERDKPTKGRFIDIQI